MDDWFDILPTEQEIWMPTGSDDMLTTCCQSSMADWDLDTNQYDFDMDTCFTSDQQSKLEPVSIKKKKSGQKWTAMLDSKLKGLAEIYDNNWEKIASFFENKTPSLLEKRYNKMKTTQQRRYLWTEEEDAQILDLYQRYGGNWKKIAEMMDRRPAETIKSRYYGKLKKQLPTDFQTIRSRPNTVSHNVPRYLQSTGLPTDPNTDQFFAFDTEVETKQDKPVAEEYAAAIGSTTSQKRQKLAEIYSKMARLEAFLNHTKSEITRLEPKAALAASEEYSRE